MKALESGLHENVLNVRIKKCFGYRNLKSSVGLLVNFL